MGSASCSCFLCLGLTPIVDLWQPLHAQAIAWLQEQIGSTARDGGIAPAIPIATTPTQHLSQSFFCRQAEVVVPELVGCRLVKRKKDGSLLWGVIVETEAD